MSDNQRVVNVIRTAIEQETSQGAKMRLTPGVVDTASGYLCSAYIREDEFAEDIHVPAGMHLTAGDYVVVGQVENTFWIDRLLPSNDYAKVEVDWNTGVIYAGTGTAQPAQTLTLTSTALTATNSFGIYDNGHLYIDANDGYQVWIGNGRSTDYVRLGNASTGATQVLPGEDGTVFLGANAWKWKQVWAKEYMSVRNTDTNATYYLQRQQSGGVPGGVAIGYIYGTAEDDVGSLPANVSIDFITYGAQTSTNHAGYLRFQTTASGSTTRTIRWVLGHDGIFYPQADETYDIGYSTLAPRNIYALNLLPANGGTPATNSTIGNSSNIWHHTFTENIKSSGDIHFYPDGSTSYDVLVSNDGIKPRVDGAMDLGTDSVRFGSIYADEVHTASPYVWLYETTGSPHTWTKPANLSYIKVEVIGGGGGGGGADDTASTEGASGGGGGGGGYAMSYFKASELPSTCTATVGDGGPGGGTAGSAGTAGDDSTWTGTGITTMTGGGGGAGSGDTGGTGRLIVDGGAVGTGSGGNAFNANGEPGWHGDRVSLSGVSAATGLASGRGGGVYGNWGFSGRWASSGAAYGGNGYGAGGTGSYNHNNGSAHTGGDGRDGVIIVTEYYA